MTCLRNILLAASQNSWLRDRASRYRFVTRTVRHFMPGETPEDAIHAACILQRNGVRTVLTYLGENVHEQSEADAVTEHYLHLLARIHSLGLPTEVSVKLSQLGLGLDSEMCYVNLIRIIEQAGQASTVWIDMEASAYVDITLGLFHRAHRAHANVGVCVQACLYRTRKDLALLIEMVAAVRLVKGAYRESPDVALQRKEDIDASYFALARTLLAEALRRPGLRVAIATHDVKLIGRIQEFAESVGLPRQRFEFQMLYGIQRAEQARLVAQGWPSTVLIAYGTHWFPWFMRRLAERPSNLLFLWWNLVWPKNGLLRSARKMI